MWLFVNIISYTSTRGRAGGQLPSKIHQGLNCICDPCKGWHAGCNLVVIDWQQLVLLTISWPVTNQFVTSCLLLSPTQSYNLLLVEATVIICSQKVAIQAL